MSTSSISVSCVTVGCPALLCNNNNILTTGNWEIFVKYLNKIHTHHSLKQYKKYLVPERVTPFLHYCILQYFVTSVFTFGLVACCLQIEKTLQGTQSGMGSTDRILTSLLIQKIKKLCLKKN